MRARGAVCLAFLLSFSLPCLAADASWLDGFDAYVEKRKEHIFRVVYYGLASREVSNA